MASSITRTILRDALQAAFPTVAYVETIATRVNNNTLADLWQTFEFVPEADRPIGIGRPTCWRESGIARVWVGAASGNGDSVAVAQADAVANAFRAFNQGGVRVLEVTPPLSAVESDGRWLLVSVDLRYQRDFYI